MADKFKQRTGDLTWGKYDYPVTKTQKDTLDGLWFLLGGTPRNYKAVPPEVFYSQTASTGAVVIGRDHKSVTVHRTGRITSNERFSHTRV